VFRHRIGDQRLPAGLVGDVLPDDALSVRDVRADHRGAFFRQPVGDCRAEARCRAGDDDDLV